MDKGFDLDLLAAFYKRPPVFDVGKSQKVLGLEFIDIRNTATDMAQATVDLGFLDT